MDPYLRGQVFSGWACWGDLGAETGGPSRPDL